MKVPRVFVLPAALSAAMASKRIALSGKEARYLGRVLRLKPGDRVEAFDGTCSCWVRLTELLRDEVHGEILEVTLPRAVAIEITLAFSCVRPGPVEEILRHGTELGVSAFVPVLSARAQRRPESKKQRWDSIVAAACAQCGRVALPRVDPPVPLDRLLDQDLSSFVKLLLSPSLDAEPLLEDLHRLMPRRILILAGPEGGFDPSEESAALNAGFRPVSLGHGVLRTETAALTAVAAVVCWHHAKQSDDNRVIGK